MKVISKKVLLASLCFIILLVAVVAYSYVEISRLGNHVSDLESQVDSLQNTVSSLEAERDSLQNNVSTLESQVDALQEEIDSLQNELSHMNRTTFVFEWNRPLIVNGTLRMEIIFTLKDGNLSIIVKINDDEYNAKDALGLAFDYDDDGVIDGGGLLYADNTKIPGNVDIANGWIYPAWYDPTPSHLHTCVFEPNVGYVFNVTVSTPPPNDLILVQYLDDQTNGVAHVWPPLHFGLPL